MKKVSLTFVFLLVYNFIFAQEIQFYDENFFPVEKKKKSNSVFFVEIESLESSLNKKFYSLKDSLLMKEIKTELNKDSDILTRVISKYRPDGKISQELTKDKNSGNFIHTPGHLIL